MKLFLTVMVWVALSSMAGAQVQPPPAPQAQPAPATPGQAAKIVCENPSFDFGAAEPNSTVEHEYVIKNAGDLTLEIRRVQPSCGCTVAQLSQQLLKPGETATIKASLNLTGRSGHQEKHIIVESNDPQTPTMILNLRGDVRQDFLITPDRLSPGQIRGDVPVEMDVVFTSGVSQAVHVVKAQSATTNLLVELSEMEAGKKYRIHVKTAAPLPPGALDGKIQIFTDYPAHPVFDVPFNAVVMGPVVVAPPQILLSAGITNPVTRFVIIRNGTATSVNVLGVESPDPAITTESVKISAGITRIQVNNVIAKPELNGKSLKITTDAEGMKEILVPFQIVPIQ